MLEQGQLTARPIDEAFANNSVQGIGASQDGGLWVVNEGRIRKWKENKWTDDLGPCPWGGSPVHALIETKKGTLAVGTADHGIYLVFPGASGNVLHFGRTNGFPSDWVISLLEDGEGNLWAGTGGGGLAVRSPKQDPDDRAARSVAGTGGFVGDRQPERLLVDGNRRRRLVSLSRWNLVQFRSGTGDS